MFSSLIYTFISSVQLKCQFCTITILKKNMFLIIKKCFSCISVERNVVEILTLMCNGIESMKFNFVVMIFFSHFKNELSKRSANEIIQVQVTLWCVRLYVNNRIQNWHLGRYIVDMRSEIMFYGS